MKLSELLQKPIKLKGKGNLILKGFSKYVADKEVGDSIKYYDSIEELSQELYKAVYLRMADNIDYSTNTGYTELEENLANVGDICTVHNDEDDNLLLIKITSIEHYPVENTCIYHFDIIKILGIINSKQVFYLSQI